MPKDEKITLYMDSSEKKRIERAAEREDRSVNNWAMGIIRKALKDQKQTAAAERQSA